MRAAAALIVLALAAPARAADGDLGARLWAERCSACHGEDGRGDGPAAVALQPRPRDLRSAEFWRGRTVAALREVVKRGKPGTMMAPFDGVLSEREIDAVVTYVARFHPSAPAPAGKAPPSGPH